MKQSRRYAFFNTIPQLRTQVWGYALATGHESQGGTALAKR